MLYQIKSVQKYLDVGSSYEAHGVVERQRIAFMFNGNLLFGIVVGCSKDSLLLEVDALSY